MDKGYSMELTLPFGGREEEETDIKCSIELAAAIQKAIIDCVLILGSEILVSYEQGDGVGESNLFMRISNMTKPEMHRIATILERTMKNFSEVKGKIGGNFYKVKGILFGEGEE